MATKLTTNVETKTTGDKTYSLIYLAGQIDESNLEDFSNEITPLIGGDTSHLVFNLKDLEFINSKVIGYLAATHGQLSESSQIMIFIEANPNILDILELVGLTQIVPTLENEEAAMQAIQSGEV